MIFVCLLREEYLFTTAAASRFLFLYIFLSLLIVSDLRKMGYIFKSYFLDMPCTYTENSSLIVRDYLRLMGAPCLCFRTDLLYSPGEWPWDLLSWSEHDAPNTKVCRFNPHMGSSLKSWTWWCFWVPSSSEHPVIWSGGEGSALLGNKQKKAWELVK